MNPDPAIAQLLLGVASNSLYSLGADVVRTEARQRRVGDRISDRVLVPAVEKAITAAVSELSSVPVIATEAGGERLRQFLRSPDIRELARALYSDYLGNDASGVPDVEEAFVLALKLWTHLPDGDARSHGSRLFAALQVICERALAVATADGDLAAHDARELARNRRLLDELANMRANLDWLRRGASPDIEELLAFEAAYRAQVVARDTQVLLPSLDDKVPRHVNDVYVKPRIHPGNHLADPLPYDVLAPEVDRAVVLGAPGAGKSTLVCKLVYDLGTDALRRGDGERRTPVVVTLKDYGEAKRATGRSLTEFVTQQATGRYQLPAVPEGAIDYLLRNARAFVLFDGLDELLETSGRAEVTRDIDSFSALYPKAPILVTSRAVGYDEAPLDPTMFARFELAEFDNDQLRSYVSRVIEADDSVPPDGRSKLTHTFVKKSASLGDLRANPLMLGLLVRLFLKTQDLPVHRAGVLEACALLLFERWDRDRGIFVPFPFRSRLLPAMQHLAYTVYVDAEMQQGVTEHRLVALTKEYLLGRRYEDPDEAEEAAHAFIGLCKGRTWVFTDVGTTPQGEPLFRFTHRAFMEYFVAGYLVRHRRTPEELLEVLAPHILRREWEVVCQLACHMRDREQEAAADELLVGIIEAAESDMRQRVAATAFCFRALEVLVPDLPTIPRLIAAWLRAVTDVTLMIPKSDEHTAAEFVGLAQPLVNINTENGAAVRRSLVQALGATGASGSPPNAVLLELVLNLEMHASQTADAGVQQVWAGFEREVAATAPDVHEASALSFTVAYDAVRLGAISVAEFARSHGIGALFARRRFASLSGVVSVPLALVALEAGKAASGVRDTQWQVWRLRFLREFAAVAANQITEASTRTMNWSPEASSVMELSAGVPSWLRDESELVDVNGWNADELFGAFCIVATLCEFGGAASAMSLARAAVSRSGSLTGLVFPHLAERYQRASSPALPLLARLGIEQSLVVTRWATGTLSFKGSPASAGY